MAREALIVGFAALVLVISVVPFNGTATSVDTPGLVAPKAYMPTVGHQSAADAVLLYHGGPIEKAPKVYLVFWGWVEADPTGTFDPDGEAAYLKAFFAGVGGSAWSNVNTQYGETARGLITNPTGQLAGVWYDNDPIDVAHMLLSPDGYIAGEAVAASQHFGFDQDADYFIMTPTGHNTAGFGSSYCAWHSATNAPGGVIAFTNMPYVTDAGGSCGAHFVNGGAAGNLDGVGIVAGHEYSEAVTDPHLNAWYASSGGENADLCAWIHSGQGAAQNIVLSTGTFAVQSHWNNAKNRCDIFGP